MDGCTISGQTLVTIPSFLNQPLDPSRPAYGYLNVVGLEHGDFHSVWVSATGPEALFTKTCPGDPPTVTTHGLKAGGSSTFFTNRISSMGPRQSTGGEGD